MCVPGCLKQPQIIKGDIILITPSHLSPTPDFHLSQIMPYPTCWKRESCKRYILESVVSIHSWTEGWLLPTLVMHLEKGITRLQKPGLSVLPLALFTIYSCLLSCDFMYSTHRMSYNFCNIIGLTRIHKNLSIMISYDIMERVWRSSLANKMRTRRYNGPYSTNDICAYESQTHSLMFNDDPHGI